MSLIHRLALAGLIAAAFIPVTVQAELGRPVASVAVDRERMGAGMKAVAMTRYTRHELTRPNGAMVHEFTNPAGAVFAVTWSGPGKPDLRTLLGKYFIPFQANSVATARTMHALRHPPQVDEPDLQIQVGGHMGWFHGVAYVPSLAPTGFFLAALQVQP